MVSDSFVVLNANDPAAISACENSLHSNDPVVFPTEIVYGIGCLIGDSIAKEKIYKLIDRENHKPLTIMVSNLSQIDQLELKLNGALIKLMNKYWPGPMTLILSNKEGSFIGVRTPDHPFALKLLNSVGPMLVTSANISDLQDSVSIQDVMGCFKNKVPVIIDGGDCKYNKSTTVLKINGQVVDILRSSDETLAMVEYYQRNL